MKKIFIILFIFLSACSNSHENKIKRSFKNQIFFAHHNAYVKDVKVYDTIEVNDILNTINHLDIISEELQTKLSNIYNYKDSIKKTVDPRIKRDSLLRNIDHTQEYLERELDMTARKQLDYVNLGKQIDDSIYAYKVRISTDKRSFDFLVSPLTFTIISPIFSTYKDSLTKF